MVGPKYDKPTGNRATLWLNGGSVAINGNVFVKNGGGNPGNTVDAGIMVFKGKVNIYSGYFYAANDATGAPNPCTILPATAITEHVSSMFTEEFSNRKQKRTTTS